MSFQDPEQRSVLSADGTGIGFTKIGSGHVPLVIVHGALSTGRPWMPAATAMAEHVTCYVMDRWGRGQSASRADYSMEHEVEDIAAVLDAAGSGAYLLGHSSGAIYALEVAARSAVAGLVLYEPPLHAFHSGRFVDEVWDRIRVAGEEGRFEDAISIFLTDEAQMPPNALASLQTTPLWKEMVATAPQSVREWGELIQLQPTVERYEALVTRTLLLAGTETEAHPSFATKALANTLPNSRTRMLVGEGHFAHLSAPERLAEVVTEFVLTTD